MSVTSSSQGFEPPNPVLSAPAAADTARTARADHKPNVNGHALQARGKTRTIKMSKNNKPRFINPKAQDALRNFLSAREDGAITTLSIFLFIAMLIIGGLALDVMHRTTQITKLQGTADAVAHAAILARRTHSEQEAIAIAHELALMNMPPRRYGEAIRRQDIEFGRWDSVSMTFMPEPGAREAARVTPRRERTRANEVRTMLLRFVGLDQWELARSAVFVAELDPCLSDGFVARGPVSFNSNNHFAAGFCVHSNNHVWLRQNNTFEPGAQVSMPNLADLDVPGGNLSGNPGLAEALTTRQMDLGILDRLHETIAELEDFGSARMPDYIFSPIIVDLDASNIRASDFRAGRIHRVSCGGSSGGNGNGNGNGRGNRGQGGGSGGNSTSLDIPNNTVLRNIVLVTDCAIRLGNGAAVEDSIIATTSTDNSSIRGSSGARFGVDRGCAEGPGTQVLTLGGMFFPANLTVHGAQLVARGTINFQANAGIGGRGVSLVAGEIDGRTNMSTDYCGTTMDNHLGESRLRLAY